MQLFWPFSSPQPSPNPPASPSCFLPRRSSVRRRRTLNLCQLSPLHPKPSFPRCNSLSFDQSTAPGWSGSPTGTLPPCLCTAPKPPKAGGAGCNTYCQWQSVSISSSSGTATARASLSAGSMRTIPPNGSVPSSPSSACSLPFGRAFIWVNIGADMSR